MNRRNSIIAALLSLVMVFTMMPLLGQVYADEMPQDDQDQYNLDNSVVTFDSNYRVLEDIESTPYPDWFYVVPAGTVLEPIVMLGDKQLSSDCYSASYSECMFYTERNEWDKIDANVWIDHFPTDVGVYFCKVEGKGAYHGTFEWIDLIRIDKAANTLKVNGKTHTVKFSKLKKKTQYLPASKIYRFADKGQGTRKFTLYSAKKGKNPSRNTSKLTQRTVSSL